MFQVLTSVYIVLIIAMVVCMRIIRKQGGTNLQSLSWMIGMGIFTATGYTLSILVPGGYEALAVFFNGVYFIGTDWLAISLIHFVADYTKIHPPTKQPKWLLNIVAVIDSISLIVNTFTRHVFTMERTASSWGEYWQIEYSTLQALHLTFVYLMVAYCVLLLLYRMVAAPWIYKIKYISLLLLLAAVVVLNLICVMLRSGYDYSVLLYGLLAMSVCYFVLYASPKQLLEDMNSKLTEESVIGLLVYDDDKHCVGTNLAAKELFGAMDDSIYTVAEAYLAKWEDDHEGRLKSVMGAERQITRDGETLYIYVNYQRLLDHKGRILGYSFQFEDRTEVVNQYQEEKYRATHDLLTGLLNRDAFEKEVAEILAKAEEPYYMLCSNLTDFKLINELCGTEVGDQLLIGQADMIRGETTEALGEEAGMVVKSVSARMYADKFCTLLPKQHFDPDRFIEKMTTLLDETLSIPLKARFCFGLYEITDASERVWTMCDKAMMAMDSIRDNYGQSFSFYEEEMLQRTIREKEILGEFDKAIEEGEFHMFLQPQIAHDGSLVGAEALVRWLHPEKGVISPADFIPVLEKVGLIHKLDLYMWEQAAKKLQEWKNAGRENLFISVNISTKDFYLVDIHDTFRELSEKYDFDIKNLKLEITESALMKDVEEMIGNMDNLHSLGYDIEIDDFGSGYSSLGMLKDIYADILKIDMIFLQKTENSRRSATILKNVIAMAKELGMPVVTEGVETKEQVDFLREAGTDIFQGFYFARPMSVDDFEARYGEGYSA